MRRIKRFALTFVLSASAALIVSVLIGAVSPPARSAEFIETSNNQEKPVLSWYSEDDLLHDRLDDRSNPLFLWHSSLIGWILYREGYISGLPDSRFRSCIISGIQFDETADTVVVITRIDRNYLSKFYIGYTDVPPRMSDYNLNKIDYGIFIDSTGVLSPSWDAGNEAYWSADLPDGLYDMRITLDRTSGLMTIDFDSIEAFDSPLSDFNPPLLSIAESMTLPDILFIQMNLYNEFSAVYDVWSVRGTPAVLMLHHPRDMVVMEGDTIEFEATADYDGDKDLVWSFDDPRFVLEGDIYRWITRDGDGGIYTETLSVTDGHLLDTVTVWYTVTQRYDSSIVHDRMNGFSSHPYDWILIDEAFWYTSLDGYLRGTEGSSWTSAAISKCEETLDEVRSWIFRIDAGAGREYAVGLTETPPDRHNGRHGNISLGILIEGDGKVSQAWYSTSTNFEETVLEEGTYDIRITWDPAVSEAQFEAVPVYQWTDSISIFSEAVWKTWADAGLSAPAWLQINVIGGTPRVYDIWSYSKMDERGVVAEHTAEARPEEIEILWTVTGDFGLGEFIIVRCPEAVEGCRELARIPLIPGMTIYGCHDRDVLPGSIHSYRVYLDKGVGREILFETDEMEVPVASAHLYQNHPNPFNPETTIRWYLPSASMVKVTVFDVSGRKVKVLVDGQFDAGVNSVVWDGTDKRGNATASGVYFYRIEAVSFDDSKKMIILR
jgi:hypothetical protein